ncbi:F-box protein CPR1-like [Papaver somniferum]|uniref:F-box protein CPR1-like n=1 Tax=Papaver somniferum TaxID=3469 RepID=UPI000E6F6284|nr:F-box protein CPR1-like [Papaver somniferum]
MSRLAGDYWRLPGDIIIEILTRHDDIQKKSHLIKIIAGKGNVLYSIYAYSKSHDTILSGVDKIVDYPLYDKKYEEPYCRLGIVGSCNGLVCIRARLDRICFWNVSTKEHKIVSEVKVHVHDQWKSSWCKYGFGYDIKTQDYKLVRFRCFEDKRLGTQIKVYSLESNSWSSALYMPYTLSLEPRPTALYMSGALHWLTDDSKLLVSFDLGDEIIREVPGPARDSFFDNDSYQYKYVDVLGGCLCIVCVVLGDRGDVWVMKDYGVRESWTKEFTVPWQVIKFDYFRPIGYVGNGKQVLLNIGFKQETNKGNFLVRYNPKRKMATTLKTHDITDPEWRHAYTYQESLFSVLGKKNSVGILHYLEPDQVEQEEATFSEPDHKRRKIAV